MSQIRIRLEIDRKTQRLGRNNCCTNFKLVRYWSLIFFNIEKFTKKIIMTSFDNKSSRIRAKFIVTFTNKLWRNKMQKTKEDTADRKNKKKIHSKQFQWQINWIKWFWWCFSKFAGTVNFYFFYISSKPIKFAFLSDKYFSLVQNGPREKMNNKN